MRAASPPRYLLDLKLWLGILLGLMVLAVAVAAALLVLAGGDSSGMIQVAVLEPSQTAPFRWG